MQEVIHTLIEILIITDDYSGLRSYMVRRLVTCRGTGVSFPPTALAVAEIAGSHRGSAAHSAAIP